MRCALQRDGDAGGESGDTACVEGEELNGRLSGRRRILRGALGGWLQGGRLVYSTCSLEAEECEQVVEAVVAEGGVKRVAVDGLVAGLGEAGILKSGVELGSALRDGALRTLPGVHGCDGFFAVVLEREFGVMSKRR